MEIYLNVKSNWMLPLPWAYSLLLADVMDNKNINILCWRRGWSQWLKSSEPGPKKKKKKQQNCSGEIIPYFHGLKL